MCLTRWPGFVPDYGSDDDDDYNDGTFCMECSVRLMANAHLPPNSLPSLHHAFLLHLLGACSNQLTAHTLLLLALVEGLLYACIFLCLNRENVLLIPVSFPKPHSHDVSIRADEGVELIIIIILCDLKRYVNYVKSSQLSATVIWFSLKSEFCGKNEEQNQNK